MEEMGVDSEKAHELSQTEITQIKNSLDENEELTRQMKECRLSCVPRANCMN